MLFPLDNLYLLGLAYHLHHREHFLQRSSYSWLGKWFAVGEILYQAMVTFLIHPLMNQYLRAEFETNTITDSF